jgi:DNA-binding NtrC family response regulator
MENAGNLSFQNEKLKVLIIDDDDFQIDFVIDQLNELGITDIVKATSGSGGLAVFDKTQPKPDLLICDIQMPDTDGFAIMKAMEDRKFMGGVILMSGQGARVLHSASLVAQLARQDFLGTIEKPVEKEALAKAIDKMCKAR